MNKKMAADEKNQLKGIESKIKCSFPLYDE